MDLSVKADAERMAAELEAKGVALKSSVDELTALESQLAQMTSTIQRLRSDRDDLKSQLRFAEAETRVGTESEQQTAAERDSLQARVLALEGDVESLTAITSERDDLADAIKIVEHEREVAQQEVKDLRQQLSEMESKHSDTLQDEQERRRKAETRVEELLLSATISEMPEDEKRKEVKALYERIDRREGMSGVVPC